MNERITCNQCEAPAPDWEDGAGYGFGKQWAQFEGVFCSSSCLSRWLIDSVHPLVWPIDVEDL